MIFIIDYLPQASVVDDRFVVVLVKGGADVTVNGSLSITRGGVTVVDLDDGVEIFI